jgi:hypothetical protein
LFGADRTAAATEQTESHFQFAFLAAFLPTFLAALPKDLPISHALAEILKGDAAHGAELL